MCMYLSQYQTYTQCRRGHNHMVIGFTTTYAISAYLFNTTFNNSLAISRRSVLLVGETAGPKENH
jgi:hypothetical protein